MSRIPPPLPPRPGSDGQNQISPLQRPTASEASSDNTFRYKELKGDDFRLILLPNRTGPRLYTIEYVDLYEAPPYLALSYSWGKEKSNAELNTNYGKLKLETKNLEIALEYLIDRYPGQYLWTDAICIKQDDEKEKGRQVPRMKDIYTRTAKCVVWLGECPGGSRLDRALPQLPGLLQKLQKYPPHLGLDEASFKRYGLPALTSALWEGLSDLMENEWFRRVWTFQESVLPKTLEILYGNHVISTDDIYQLASIIAAMPESGGLKFMGDAVSDRRSKVSVGLTRVITVAAARHQRTSLIPTQYTFLDLITSGVNWSVTKPCDRIYGMLALFEDRGLEKHLEPCMANEPNELFLHFAKYWIQQDKHYQLFHFVPSNHFVSDWDGPQGKPTKSNDENLNKKEFRGRGLPSWCPSPLDLGNATSFWHTGYTAKYTAGIEPGRGRSPIRSVPDKDDEIQVEGFTVDKIILVEKCPWERQEYGNDLEAKAAGLRETLDWERRCLQISRSTYHAGNPAPHLNHLYQQENLFIKAAQGLAGFREPKSPILRVAQDIAGKLLNAAANVNANRGPAVNPRNGQDDVPDAHWRTLIANKDGNGKFYTGNGAEAYRLVSIYLNNSLTQSDLTRPQFNAKQQALIQDYLQAFGFAAHGRAFVRTECGRIGLAPQHTQAGDKVVILWNAGSPYVLRPVGGRNFKLVGEAYIHGIMYGEAIKGRQGVRDEWFILE